MFSGNWRHMATMGRVEHIIAFVDAFAVAQEDADRSTRTYQYSVLLQMPVLLFTSHEQMGTRECGCISRGAKLLRSCCILPGYSEGYPIGYVDCQGSMTTKVTFQGFQNRFLSLMWILFITFKFHYFLEWNPRTSEFIHEFRLTRDFDGSLTFSRTTGLCHLACTPWSHIVHTGITCG